MRCSDWSSDVCSSVLQGRCPTICWAGRSVTNVRSYSGKWVGPMGQNAESPEALAMKLEHARSLLFLPASNRRAIEKARGLACDMVILDLEDAVPDAQKDEASGAAIAALSAETSREGRESVGACRSRGA